MVIINISTTTSQVIVPPPATDSFVPSTRPSPSIPPPAQNLSPAKPPKINDPPLTMEAINTLTPKLNAILSAPATSPILLLKQFITTLVSAPPPVVSFHVACLLEVASSDTDTISLLPHGRIAGSYFAQGWPLSEHRLVTCLLLVLAASKQHVKSVHDQFRAQGEQGGAVDLKAVHQFSSCNLRAQYAHAVTEAVRKERTTMIGVQLVDVGILEMIEAGGKRAVQGKIPFGYTFAMIVGPEGAIIWCAGPKHLENWVQEGHDKLGDWEDGEQWIGDFERLVMGELVGIAPILPFKGFANLKQDGKTKGWNSKRFKRYRRCFGVDLRKKAEEAGKQLLEEVQPWVRVFRIDDVVVEDVKKWRWKEE